VISYWKKDELRSHVKKLKQKMDELDKNRKVAIMNEVSFILFDTATFELIIICLYLHKKLFPSGG
jgi:hypothetical protein